MRTRENTERALLVYTGGVIEGLDNLKNPINIEIEIEDEIVWFQEKCQDSGDRVDEKLVRIYRNVVDYTDLLKRIRETLWYRTDHCHVDKVNFKFKILDMF